jgi:hypothetical protein
MRRRHGKVQKVKQGGTGGPLMGILSEAGRGRAPGIFIKLSDKISHLFVSLQFILTFIMWEQGI